MIKFTTLDKAEADAGLKGPQCKVWARDVSERGAKEWYSGTFEEYYSLYEVTPPAKRCFHEVLLERTPVNLYVDVDGPPNMDRGLISVLHAAVSSALACAISMLVLEAHREAKCSFHLIFVCKTFKFDGPASAGAFLRRLDIPDELRKCIDYGVYKRRQCWRCPLNSKFGKPYMLLPLGNESFSFGYRDYLAQNDHPVQQLHFENAAHGPAPKHPNSRFEDINVPVPSFLHNLAGPLGLYGTAKRTADGRYIRATMRNRECVRDNTKTHASNHVFLVIDTMLLRYKKQCFSFSCGRASTGWLPLSERARRQIAAQALAEWDDKECDKATDAQYIELDMGPNRIPVPRDLMLHEFRSWFCSPLECSPEQVSVLVKANPDPGLCVKKLTVTDGLDKSLNFYYDVRSQLIVSQ